MLRRFCVVYDIILLYCCFVSILYRNVLLRIFYIKHVYSTLNTFLHFTTSEDVALSEGGIFRLMAKSRQTAELLTVPRPENCTGKKLAHRWLLPAALACTGGILHTPSSVLPSVRPYVSIVSSESTDRWPWTFAGGYVMTIVCRGLKIKVIGQGQGHGSG